MGMMEVTQIGESLQTLAGLGVVSEYEMQQQVSPVVEVNGILGESLLKYTSYAAGATNQALLIPKDEFWYVDNVEVYAAAAGVLAFGVNMPGITSWSFTNGSTLVLGLELNGQHMVAPVNRLFRSGWNMQFYSSTGGASQFIGRMLMRRFKAAT